MQSYQISFHNQEREPKPILNHTILDAIKARHVAAGFGTCDDIVCAKCIGGGGKGYRDHTGTAGFQCLKNAADWTDDAWI